MITTLIFVISFPTNLIVKYYFSFILFSVYISTLSYFCQFFSKKKKKFIICEIPPRKSIDIFSTTFLLKLLNCLKIFKQYTNAIWYFYYPVGFSLIKRLCLWLKFLSLLVTFGIWVDYFILYNFDSFLRLDNLARSSYLKLSFLWFFNFPSWLVSSCISCT